MPADLVAIESSNPKTPKDREERVFERLAASAPVTQEGGD
jgi:hypothetical protein